MLIALSQRYENMSYEVFLGTGLPAGKRSRCAVSLYGGDCAFRASALVLRAYPLISIESLGCQFVLNRQVTSRRDGNNIFRVAAPMSYQRRSCARFPLT